MTSTRREFLIMTGAAALGASASNGQSAPVPWYARRYRWASAGFAGKDSGRFEVAWWREQWKRTAAQGAVIEAGGVAAYYPSKIPLHRPAQFLGGRDLFGELSEAAHGEGLAVLASVDSASFGEEALMSHPDWVARTQDGQPVRAIGGYAPCVHSAYIEEYLHPIFLEVVGRYRSEGIVGSHWEGLWRDAICHCENCAKRFRAQKGKALPKTAKWNDPAFGDWIRWSYARRLEIWDLNNRITKTAGGASCLWVGMHPASRLLQSLSFRDGKEIARRSPLLLIENLSRNEGGGFWQNSSDGRYFGSLTDPGRNVIEVTAMYQAGSGPFPAVSNPMAEARQWMVSGLAGGFQPCYRHAAGFSEDRREYQIAPPLMQWHQKNERYLANRTAVATVGVVWSQSSNDFYGRESSAMLSEIPFRGMVEAVGRTNIPYTPMHVSDIDREGQRLAVLVLPNVGSMSDAECASVRRFVERGGTLVATGVSSLYDQNGEQRSDYGLASVFGAHVDGVAPDRLFYVTAHGAASVTPGTGLVSSRVASLEAQRASPGRLFVVGPYTGPATEHSYLRLRPELAATTDGPHNSEEPRNQSGTRHPILAGFEKTDILPFGGTLGPLRVDTDRTVLMTYIPGFGQQPEVAWMREPRTNRPGLIVGAFGKGRVAFLPADLDRRFGMDPIPDHGRLLENVIRWATGENNPLTVESAAIVGTYLYQQADRLILHIVNETGTDNQSGLLDEIYPVGPVKVRLKLPDRVKGTSVRMLVAEISASPAAGRTIEFEIPRLTDHEVVVIE